jgi:para-aminobenzoate synthetase component I
MLNNQIIISLLDHVGSEKISLLHSAKEGKSLLALTPKESISSNNIEEFRNFAKRNQKRLIIGYIAYDTCYELLNIKQKSKDDLKLPRIHFKSYNDWIEVKNNKIVKGKNLYEALKKRKVTGKQGKTKATNFKATTSEKQYQKAYKKIQEYIKEGDIYQVNLTHRLEGQSTENSREIFKRVVKDNPVNHLAYIEGKNFEILSASPERFIKISNGTIETRPTKGTRPRGKGEESDKKMKNELIESKKEAAELNMITDLLRNDLGVIAKTGTVKVEGHRLLQKCPSVWHTYSKITAKINTSSIDALISMLPGGSITGCPKKRAVEIIDELEPLTRGIYTGVIGYIDPNQNLDFSIAIRTIIKKEERVLLQVGGGIVLDSTSKSEYKETLDKAKSFMKIL